MLFDHYWRQQNRLWTKNEIEGHIKTFDKHQVPKSITGYLLWKLMRFLYLSFNVVTFFNKKNICEKSCFTRLFLLESVAGLPGVVSAFIRHTRSLRTLKHDKDFIFTLEEEAENERMHLMICLEM